jgi:uncharacterized protein YggE
MYQHLSDKEKRQMFAAILGVLILLAIFLLAEVLNTVKQFSYIGRGITAGNTVTVNGEGEVLAVPDIAVFSFSVVADSKQVADAQNSAAAKMNSVIAALKTLGVAETDIQTTDYSSDPTYSYQNSVCPQPPQPLVVQTSGAVSGAVIYCPPGKQILTGYEVSQTVSVKIRKTADAGTILAKVGGLGVSNISGLTFTVDDMNAVQTEARDKAIANAKAEAAELSKSLGIKLSHIVNFSENGNYPMPYAVGAESAAANAGAAASVPQIPTGQNTVTSNVSITYEVD